MPNSPSPSIPQEAAATPWYLLEAEWTIGHFQTSAGVGLSQEAVQVRLERDGRNVLPEIVGRSRWNLLISQFMSVPVALLSLAAGVSVLTDGIADAVVIMGVVLINAAIGYITESQSDRIIRSLKQLVKPTAIVLREGVVQEVSAQEVVLGDILVLRPGISVAADARVIEAKRLTVDESALTGESLPVTKSIEPLETLEIPLADRVNMVYLGTLVTGGQGLAVVVATGSLTEMGQIQAMVGEATLPETPMERQLDRAGSQLVWLSSAVCAVVFGLGLLRGYALLEMLKTSISLAVAAVPEGLPTIATTTLALGIRTMRQHKVLIRRLDAIEALGSMQTLCLDKTGTLTLNRMRVAEISIDGQQIQIPSRQQLNDYLENAELSQSGLLKLAEIIVLCNECEVVENGLEPKVRGSSTECALIDLAIELGLNVAQLRADYPVVKTFHRSETQNFMETRHLDRSGFYLQAVKGNPLEVLALCDRRLRDGDVLPLTREDQRTIEAENDRMAEGALRVLGVAYGYTSDLEGHPPKHLVWLGLVGIADPIREGVKEVVALLHQAGIRTIMITGDQSRTAYAIGRELDLSQGEELTIVDASDVTHFEAIANPTWGDRVHIFARISPAHKLQVVRALQQAGKVVAMTGDGINDAPALKAAAVGIAMGETGTDVAREVADVILEEDDLGTMAIAIQQGRTIYSNIRKAVHFLLATNLSEILVMLAGTSLGLGQPLNAMQLLWLNLVTDIFPGLALALETAEPNVMRQPPRDPQEAILRRADFGRIGVESGVISLSALGAYCYGLQQYGIGTQASTIAFMSLTLGQLLHAMSCRSQFRCVWSARALPANPYLAIALVISIGLQLASAAIPELRQLLHLGAIHLRDAAIIGVSALLPLLVNEATKPKAELEER